MKPQKSAVGAAKPARSHDYCHSVIDNDFRGDFPVSPGFVFDLNLNRVTDRRGEFIAMAQKRGYDVRLTGGDCGEWVCRTTADYWQAWAIVHKCAGVDMSRPVAAWGAAVGAVPVPAAVPVGMAETIDDLKAVQAVKAVARGGAVLDGGVWAGMGESLRCFVLSLVAGTDWERWHKCAWSAMPDALRDALTVEIKAIRREVGC